MKNAFLLFLIFVSSFNYSQSNQVLDFKPGYSAETVYNQTTINASDYEVLYSGSEKLTELLKNSGTENPTKIKTNFNVETVSKTGKTDKTGNFPITIEYLKADDGKGKAIIPSGTILYGKASADNMPIMDSIVSKGMEESFKNSIFQTVQSTFKQLALPQKKLKIGESFSQESPLSIPVAGINFDMQITTTYTLKSITQKNAFFDVAQVYTMKIQDDRFDTKGAGKGSGTLTYDIPNHFATENTLSMDLDLELKNNDFSINLKSKTSFSQTSTISKKK